MSNDWQQDPSQDPGAGYQQGYADSSPQDPWVQGAGDPYQVPSGHQPPIHQPGQSPYTPKPAMETNDIIAVVLAFFFPGSGQIMLGQMTKGIVLLAVYFFTCGGLGLLPFVSAFDAYCVAITRKRRPLGEWEFFPDVKDVF